MPALLIPRETSLRSSITLPGDLDAAIAKIADARHVSLDHALADLIRDGIAVYERDRANFFAVANQLLESTDPSETARLGDELDRLIFGV